MGILALDSLAEGMSLKADVHDRSGRLLLGCGTELNAKHLRIFRMWGITEADIVDIDDEICSDSRTTEVDPTSLTVAEQEMRPIFRNTNLDYPAMGELFRLCLIRKVNHGVR